MRRMRSCDLMGTYLATIMTHIFYSLSRAMDSVSLGRENSPTSFQMYKYTINNLPQCITDLFSQSTLKNPQESFSLQKGSF